MSYKSDAAVSAISQNIGLDQGGLVKQCQENCDSGDRFETITCKIILPRDTYFHTQYKKTPSKTSNKTPKQTKEKKKKQTNNNKNKKKKLQKNPPQNKTQKQTETTPTKQKAGLDIFTMVH